MLVFHAHTCLLIACLHTHCMLAYSSLHLHQYTCILTLAYFALGCFRSSTYTACHACTCSCCSASVVEVSVCKCKYRSVSVQGIFRKNPSQCFREKKRIYGGGRPPPGFFGKKLGRVTTPWLARALLCIVALYSAIPGK